MTQDLSRKIEREGAGLTEIEVSSLRGRSSWLVRIAISLLILLCCNSHAQRLPRSNFFMKRYLPSTSMELCTSIQHTPYCPSRWGRNTPRMSFWRPWSSRLRDFFHHCISYHPSHASKGPAAQGSRPRERQSSAKAYSIVKMAGWENWVLRRLHGEERWMEYERGEWTGYIESLGICFGPSKMLGWLETCNMSKAGKWHQDIPRCV